MDQSEEGWCENIFAMQTRNRYMLICHVIARKLYLQFHRFAGEAILCSNFFCYLLFFDLILLIKINYFDFRLEISSALCVFTFIFQINKKLNFAQKYRYDFLALA